MNKKVIIAIVMVVIIAGVAGGYFWMNSNKAVVTPVAEKTEEPTPVKKALSDTMKEFKDPAGFSFSYPDNLTVDPIYADSTIYSSLEIMSPDATGSITIKVTDSAFKTLADWEKKNKATDSATMSDTKLADLDAKEMKTADTTTLVAIDKGGVLFTIIMEPKGQMEIWPVVYQKVVSSFAFAAPESSATSTSTGTSGGGGVITEEEEVVE